MSVHKSLDTIKSSSVINYFTFDNLILRTELDMSIKPINFVPGLIPRSEWMLVPPIFTADIPAGSSKRALRFSGSLQW